MYHRVSPVRDEQQGRRGRPGQQEIAARVPGCRGTIVALVFRVLDRGVLGLEREAVRCWESGFEEVDNYE